MVQTVSPNEWTSSGVSADAEELVRRLWFAMDARDWAAVRSLLDDDFVAELPVSGERFVGPDDFVTMNCEYPGGWSLSVVRVIANGNRAASEIRFRSNGKTESAVSFYQLKESRLWWAADWWPEPYPAPASRAHLAAPRVEPERRTRAMDDLDDERYELLKVIEALPAEDLTRPLAGREWRRLDVLIHIIAWDEAALSAVRALSSRTRPVGENADVHRFNNSAVRERRHWTSEQALPALYRARADLRLALWEAQPDVWSQGSVVAVDGGEVSLPSICRNWSEHDREHAADLRGSGDAD